MTDGNFISILLIAIGLAADCFAVALSGGISNKNLSWPQWLRVAFSFGFFQAMMPVLGWLAGRTVVEYIEDYDHWIAFGLLVIIGGRMLWEAFRPEDEEANRNDISKGLVLITLSIATSIDALAVGLSFAFLEVNIGLASGTIGIVAFIATIIGFLVGQRAARIIGKRAEMLGGFILIAIAIRILVSHLL